LLSLLVRFVLPLLTTPMSSSKKSESFVSNNVKFALIAVNLG
jgi:hypothetical protein